MSPCAYDTSNITSTRNSGPYIVSGDQTFYRNRAYISLQTAYAKDRCGFIGGQHSGTLLTLMSSEVYSIGGYHHQFQDIGYSVNYADFSSVPADAYYQSCNSESAFATLCSYIGTRYRYGTDFINGMSTIDFGNLYEPDSKSNQWIWDEAYAPTLLVPLQMRQLDSAWSTCSWNLNGLYDPPRLLSQEITYPTPTYPSRQSTASARPASPPTNSGAPETAGPHTSTVVPSSTPDLPIHSTAPADPAPQSPASPTIDQPTRSFGSDPAGNSQKPPDPPVNSGTISMSGFLPPIVETTRAAKTANALSVLSSAEHTIQSADPSSHPTHLTPNVDPTTQQREALTFTADHQIHTIAAVPTATGLYAVDGSYTITEGAPAITMDGMRISAGTCDVIMVGSRLMTLSASASATSSEMDSGQSGVSTTGPSSFTPSEYTVDGPTKTGSDVPTSGEASMQTARSRTGFLIWFITLVASLAWL